MACGEPLTRICRDDKMPHRVTVLRWMDKNQEFAARYARARENQADYLAEEMQDVSDVATPEDVQVARLRVLTMQWRASKLAPKKYGDRIATEHSGPNGGPIPLEVRRSIHDPTEPG